MTTMAQRFKDAQTAQNGACNPRPIAAALINAIGECYTEGVAPYEDCAVFLILHQLVFILNDGNQDTGDLGKYMGAMDALELKLKED